jgi:hypothetical protein
MDYTGPTSRITVARYDDDYPLLYGEPAPQPQWKSTKRCVRLPQEPNACDIASPRAASCRSCGRCTR